MRPGGGPEGEAQVGLVAQARATRRDLRSERRRRRVSGRASGGPDRTGPPRPACPRSSSSAVAAPSGQIFAPAIVLVRRRSASRAALRNLDHLAVLEPDCAASPSDPLAIALGELGARSLLEAAHGGDDEARTPACRRRTKSACAPARRSGPEPTSSRDCRKPAPRAGRCERSRRRRRSAPSRNGACPRRGRPMHRPFRGLPKHVIGHRADVAVDLPEVTTMKSPIVLLPVRSIVTVSSAFMSSSRARTRWRGLLSVGSHPGDGFRARAGEPEREPLGRRVFPDCRRPAIPIRVGG